ncbi:hypothetical protein [uncultured Acinetobacter sp.]|uniref:hypothetical protein n=1 Tax=uncultured Acinetobacter sp. TaxID=165433 RepID=UPI00258E6C3A|nr:hypothetical protein [uncultured Acinetobacter sp.]
MKKKTLKEKINKVCWWTAGLTVLYFIVGAFLKSDGTKFDPVKTYDLIKDTLTLTATFLAPVAAFVLFSDWRKQHEDVALESDSTNVFNRLNDVKDKLLEAHFAIDDEKFDVEHVNEILSEITTEIKNIRSVNSQIKARKNGINFSECADKLIDGIVALSLDLSQLSVYKIKILNPEEYNDYVETSPEEYAEHIQFNYYNALLFQITRSYPNLNTLKANLSSLCDELKVRTS